jgi:aminodeoxyfutalosine synthase
MTTQSITSDLKAIEEKLNRQERLNFQDGLTLFRYPDLEAIGRMANRVREAKNSDHAYYIINRHINYSNVCSVTCLFCAFARRKGQEGGYTFSLDQIFHKAEELKATGGTELHIVGGLHPDLPFEFYEEMLSGLKEHVPGVHIKAFTAVEIDYFTQISNLSIEEVLKRLMAAGLDSLPGGGAEIFAPVTRKKICRTKTDAERWAQVHRVAHRLGLKSTCTMLYGHIESLEDRVDHILRLRNLQDETHGFTAYIPLAFHPENTFMPDVPAPTAEEALRNIAVGRLMLDNIQHIKVYWITHGLTTAKKALSYGADDIDGTVVEEKIYHMAGSDTPQEVGVEHLCQMVRDAGRVPVLRDSVYNIVKVQ